MIVQDIIEDRIQENQMLEYKSYKFEDGKFKSLTEKEKAKLAKEITSFANADGGEIIIGIGEDSHHNPTEIIDVGVNDENFEEWEQSFRLYIKSKIKPIIHGINCKLEKVDDKNVIIIKINKSIVKPHAFFDGNKDEFFIRYGNICNNMSLEDLEQSFSNKELLKSNITKFRDNRIGMILNDEIVGNISEKTILVVHIIPVWSMNINSLIDIRKVKYNSNLDVFSPTPFGDGRRGTDSYNTDGLLINYGFGELPTMSYTQLFNNGCIESSEIRLMNVLRDNENIIYKWTELENILYKRIFDFSKILEEYNIPKPYNVFVSILNGKSKRTLLSDFNDRSKPLSRDIIKSIPAYLNDDLSFEESMYPLFRNLSNAFGKENSSLYNEDGSLKI